MFIISRRLWTFCFGHQLWSFLISCVFQPVFISLFDVPKYILLRSILGILELSIFHCHGHWFYVWSAIGVYLNGYQTMSLKPIFAFRPGAICLNDSMIVDWMICVRMCLHRPRPFSNFFLSNLQGYTIDQEWLRLTSWAFYATGSLLWDYRMWPFYYLGVKEMLIVVTHLDNDFVNRRNDSNKMWMDFDIFTFRYD